MSGPSPKGKKFVVFHTLDLLPQARHCLVHRDAFFSLAWTTRLVSYRVATITNHGLVRIFKCAQDRQLRVQLSASLVFTAVGPQYRYESGTEFRQNADQKSSSEQDGIHGVPVALEYAAPEHA